MLKCWFEIKKPDKYKNKIDYNKIDVQVQVNPGGEVWVTNWLLSSRELRNYENKTEK